ncbi:hypothetical protein K3495_g4788 [Podosphaera aphanis]|nr:hypothetical protein K3495_g4788 [Podosphaera aphanis]
MPASRRVERPPNVRPSLPPPTTRSRGGSPGTTGKAPCPMCAARVDPRSGGSVRESIVSDVSHAVGAVGGAALANEHAPLFERRKPFRDPSAWMADPHGIMGGWDLRRRGVLRRPGRVGH